MKRTLGRLAALVSGEEPDREAQDELAHHVELAVAAKLESGLEPREARRQVRIELGDPEAAREQLREGRMGFRLDLFMKDTTLAFRYLRKRPAFAAVCIVTIGLGVGASTALFALVDGVVLRPLPLPDPATLVSIHDTHLSKGVNRTGVASGNLRDWRERVTRLEGVAGHYTMGRTLTTGSDSDVVLSAQVTDGFFSLLRTEPAAGRVFTSEETAAAVFNGAAAPVGTNLVAMISHGLWQRRFGGDPGVVGRSIMIDRKVFRVIGVTPEGFVIPGPDVQVFLPWAISPTAPRDQHYLSAVARLAPGVSLKQAEDELKSVASGLALEHPKTNEGWSVDLLPLQEDIIGDSSRGLFVLLGAVGLVLLVACANVALLSLARGLERVHEASIRLALGASRRRLLGQFLVEAVLVSLAGGALGALLAQGAISMMKAMATDLPRVQEVTLDPRALLFACAASAAAALISGLPSAWKQAQAKPSPALLGSPVFSSARGRRTLRDGLVIAEVALAVVLLAGASLLIRSYQRLSTVDSGFNAEGVLVAPIFLDMENYGGGDRSRAYYDTLVERLEALPGVIAAGGATALPASPLGPDFERPVWPAEGTNGENVKRQAWVRIVTPGYFETLGVRVLTGRSFDRRDGPDGARTIILCESLARRLWPGTSAVGQQLVVDYSSSGTYPYEVVGVVNDVRFSGPRSAPRQEIYLAHAQRPYLILNMAVRTKGDPRLLAPSVRATLHDLDARMPAQGLYPLDELLGATYARDRRSMMVLSAFAFVAMLLSLLGVHGMLSHHVRERSREIGIRIAVGATRPHLMLLVAGRGLRLSLAGLVLGCALASMFGEGVRDLLFDVPLTDPAVLLAVLALPVIAFAVSLHPAWNATRIDPAEVLRSGV